MEWLGYSATNFTHSAHPLPLHGKDGTKTDLATLIRAGVPPCHLNPLLFNGHVQTMNTAKDKSAPDLHYKRHVFTADDPRFAGTFAVDFVVPPSTPVTPAEAQRAADDGLYPRTTYFSAEQLAALGGHDERPLLIALHGLSGGSYESYLRHVLAPLVAPGGGDGTGGGWEALVVISRGCAASKITSGMLYNARSTWDVRQVVKWCRQRWPRRRLFGVGFSLGANMLTNYLGEEGDGCELEAACIISSPWKLEPASIAMQSSYVGMEVYSRAMGANLKRLYNKHKDVLLEHTSIDPAEIEKVKYLHEFDRVVQCASWGYPTEGAYYRDASSVDAIFDIRTPTFVLHAEDDPIAPKCVIPFEEAKTTPYVVICTTTMGGHLAWYQTGGQRWHVRPVVNFFEKMLKEVDVKATKANAPPTELEPPAPRSSYKSPFLFDALRRKAQVKDAATGDPFQDRRARAQVSE